MKFKPLLLLFSLTISGSTIAQSPPAAIKINAILVDWDNKQFKNELPVGESFTLKVFSKNPIPTDLTLVRFLDTRNTFYFKELPITKLGITVNNVKVNEPTKITRKQQLTPPAPPAAAAAAAPPAPPAPFGPIDETKEYTDNPDAIYAYVNTYLVKQVDANFSYALMRGVDYKDGVDHIHLKNNIINSASGLPLTNTESERINEKFVLPIIGVAYHPDQKFVLPYAGLRFSPLSPINRRTLVRYKEMKAQSSRLIRYIKPVAIDIGIALSSAEDATRNRKNLFGSSSLLLGLSYPLGPSGAYLSAGTTLFNYQPVATEPAAIHSTYYLSVSFNIELSPIFQSFSKLLGVK